MIDKPKYRSSDNLRTGVDCFSLEVRISRWSKELTQGEIEGRFRSTLSLPMTPLSPHRRRYAAHWQHFWPTASLGLHQRPHWAAKSEQAPHFWTFKRITLPVLRAS